MPTNSVNFRWSIGEGTRRVECNSGHAEVIGVTGAIPNCTAKTGAVVCNKVRVVVATGPYNYNPADLAQKAVIQAIVTWP